jgi:hypothetical protein
MDAILVKPKTKKQLNLLKRLLVDLDVDSEIMHVEEATTVYEVNGLKVEKASIQKHDEEITDLITSTNPNAKDLRRKSWTR